MLGQAVQVLGSILNELAEFGGALDIIEAILPRVSCYSRPYRHAKSIRHTHADRTPQILETHNLPLTAALYTTLADAHVGLAGTLSEDPAQQNSNMASAAVHLERAYDLYTILEDLDGKLDCLAKKQMLARWKGDGDGYDKAESMYLQILDDHEREMRERS